MARRKNSMALFEAISRSKDRQQAGGFVSPSWLTQQAQQAEAVRQSSQQEVLAGPTHQGDYAKAGGQQAMPPQAAAEENERARLTLSLSYPLAAVAGAGLVMALLLAFLIGRATAVGRTAPAPVVKDNGRISQELPAPPTGGVNAGIGNEVSPAPAARIQGKYYLVIQALNDGSDAGRQEAERIVSFLGQHNKAADAAVRVIAGRPKWVVWSLQPVDSDRSQQAKAFAQGIEELGRQYFSLHQTYKFNQGTSPWYQKHPW